MRRKAALVAGTLAVMGTTLGLSSGVAGATYLDCSGGQVFDVPGMRGTELYAVYGSDVKIYDLGFSLEPGLYSVNVSSFDGYIGRKDVPVEEQEKSERWYAQFLDAAGEQVGELDRPTTDLPDDTDVAEVIDVYQAVELTGTATQVRLVLVHDLTDSLNLVHVGCLGFDLQQTPVTTWATTQLPQDTTPPPPLAQDSTPTSPTAPAVVVLGANVSAPSTATPTVPVVRAATLPFTGDHTGLIAVIGGASVLLGFALIARSRQAEV